VEAWIKAEDERAHSSSLQLGSQNVFVSVPPRVEKVHAATTLHNHGSGLGTPREGTVAVALCTV
jgi:hypothetical protein